MNIFFTTSPMGLQKNPDFIQDIVRFLKKEGHDVTTGFTRAKNTSTQESLYTKNMESIRNADVCIFEATEHTILLGHQLTYAVERRIPVLVIVHEYAFGVFKDEGVAGYTSPFLKFYEYVSRDTVYAEIQSFLEKNSGEAKYRVDMNLSTTTHNAITQYAHKHHITKVAVIKRMLEDMLNSE